LPASTTLQRSKGTDERNDMTLEDFNTLTEDETRALIRSKQVAL
jgi:hypothetical protein